MKKILSFDKIYIEVTRRCNLSCAHCLRGDAENIDLSYENIDALLNQTEMINSLFFTGGEPSICVDKLEYFIDKIIENNIFLAMLKIVINGKEQSSAFVKVIKKYSDYIKSLLGENTDMSQFVEIVISMDRYHKGYNALDSYYFYKVNLYEYARVSTYSAGDNPVNKGRGKELPEMFWYPPNPSTHHKIEILSKDSKPICPNYAFYNLYYPEQIYICCELYVTAKGEILNAKFADDEYSKIDSMTFCHVTDNIYEKILEYNKGKPLCIECLKAEKEEMEKMNKDILNINFMSLPNKRERLKNLFDYVVNSCDEASRNYELMKYSVDNYDTVCETSQKRDYRMYENEN